MLGATLLLPVKYNMSGWRHISMCKSMKLQRHRAQVRPSIPISLLVALEFLLWLLPVLLFRTKLRPLSSGGASCPKNARSPNFWYSLSAAAPKIGARCGLLSAECYSAACTKNSDTVSCPIF